MQEPPPAGTLRRPSAVASVRRRGRHVRVAPLVSTLRARRSQTNLHNNSSSRCPPARLSPDECSKTVWSTTIPCLNSSTPSESVWRAALKAWAGPEAMPPRQRRPLSRGVLRGPAGDETAKTRCAAVQSCAQLAPRVSLLGPAGGTTPVGQRDSDRTLRIDRIARPV